MENLALLYGKIIAALESQECSNIEILGKNVFSNDFTEWEIILINGNPYIEKRSLEISGMPVERICLDVSGDLLYFLRVCRVIGLTD